MIKWYGICSILIREFRIHSVYSYLDIRPWSLLNGAENMTAYEFYWRDEKDSTHLIGILAERRRKPERVSRGSIMNWLKKVLGDEGGISNVFFVQVTIDQKTGEISESNPIYRTQRQRLSLDQHVK